MSQNPQQNGVCHVKKRRGRPPKEELLQRRRNLVFRNVIPIVPCPPPQGSVFVYYLEEMFAYDYKSANMLTCQNDLRVFHSLHTFYSKILGW